MREKQIKQHNFVEVIKSFWKEETNLPEGNEIQMAKGLSDEQRKMLKQSLNEVDKFAKVTFDYSNKKIGKKETKSVQVKNQMPNELQMARRPVDKQAEKEIGE